MRHRISLFILHKCQYNIVKCQYNIVKIYANISLHNMHWCH